MWPHWVSDDIKDLITGILDKDQDNRYGQTEIGGHKFYASVNWDQLYNKTRQVPYKPQIFDEIVQDYEINRGPEPDPVKLNELFASKDLFAGFTFESGENNV